MHNPDNAQKPADSDNSADIADSALGNSSEVDSRLLEALAAACRGLAITPLEVRDALTPEDIQDWRKGEITAEALTAFARSLAQRREMDQGKVPAHYTERATCQHCGPVWLWFTGEVSGCPWCWNRLAERPIPRPEAVRCADCMHFRPKDHSHLGHCARGQPEAIAGLWDSDRRECDYFAPNPADPDRRPESECWPNLNQKGGNYADD